MYMNIILKNDVLDRVLNQYQSKIGKDYQAYRNHCYRVMNLAFLFSDKSTDSLEKISIACAFHDLGIWTHNSLDYIGPSIEMARSYITQYVTCDWLDEISKMIDEHHKISHCDFSDLADAFRKADWIDVSMGILSLGMDRQFIKHLYKVFPTHGFHWRLTQLSINSFIKNPLNPLPMFKW